MVGFYHCFIRNNSCNTCNSVQSSSVICQVICKLNTNMWDLMIFIRNLNHKTNEPKHLYNVLMWGTQLANKSIFLNYLALIGKTEIFIWLSSISNVKSLYRSLNEPFNLEHTFLSNFIGLMNFFGLIHDFRIWKMNLSRILQFGVWRILLYLESRKY